MAVAMEPMSILSLPPEMMERVVHFMGQPDLRNLRLVCRDLSSKSVQSYAKAHFAELSVPLHRERSLKRFRYIAQHKVFSTFIQSVTLRVELISEQRVSRDEIYCQQIAFAKRGPLFQQLTRARAVVKHQYRLLCGAPQWTGATQDLAILHEIFSTFKLSEGDTFPATGFAKLRVEAFSSLGPAPQTSQRPIDLWSLLKPPPMIETPTTLSADNVCWGYYGCPNHDDIWAVQNVLRALAHSFHQPMHLSLGNSWYSVPLEVFRVRMTRPGLYADDLSALTGTFESLRCLTLNLHTVGMTLSPGVFERSCDGLVTLLSAAKNLQHLELSFFGDNTYAPSEHGIKAFGMIANHSYMPFLRALFLDATFAVNRCSLGCFVQRHIDTLQIFGFNHTPDRGMYSLHANIEALEEAYLLPRRALNLVGTPDTGPKEELESVKELNLCANSDSSSKLTASGTKIPMAEWVYQIYCVPAQVAG